MTTIHTQHGLHIVDTEADDDPLYEPYSLAELAFSIVCVGLVVFIIGACAGYVWRLM